VSFGWVVALAKLEERKRFVVETMRRLDRPIWAGDVATNAMEQELYRAAFRALAEEGKVVRRPRGKGARAYYYFN
jgi:hypothetical protein